MPEIIKKIKNTNLFFLIFSRCPDCRKVSGKVLDPDNHKDFCDTITYNPCYLDKIHDHETVKETYCKQCQKK